VNARLLDPASGLDCRGVLVTEGPRIAELGPEVLADGAPEGLRVIDCEGHCLAPGLVDMRVQLREPGEEHKETIETASRAAAAGGVTTLVALPNTDPVVDDVAGVEFVARRAREVKLVKVFTYGSVTRGTEGKELTELGLLAEYGAVAFTDGVTAVADANVMRRALAYARTFDSWRPGSGCPASRPLPRSSWWSATCAWWSSPAGAITPPTSRPPRPFNASPTPRRAASR
jgi:dihydroorotase